MNGPFLLPSGFLKEGNPPEVNIGALFQQIVFPQLPVKSLKSVLSRAL